MADQKNEGEGNKTAARHYNEKTERFAQSGEVDQKAREAKDALERAEGHELEKAEAEGKSHARGEDPAVQGKKKIK